MSKIHLTAALPTFANSNIIWLQLESLCRQECNLNWELIISEEQGVEGMFGEAGLSEFKERLTLAGCKKIKYIPLKKRLPLSKKWWLMAQYSEGESYALCGSDDYSSPDRFELSHSILQKGYDWFNIKKGLFLNVQTMHTGTFVAENIKRGLTMCTQTSLVKNIKDINWPTSSVDNWLQQKMSNFYQHEENVAGLDTDGSNIICSGRRILYSDKHWSQCFIPPEQVIEDILPQSIIDKIKTTKFFYPERFIN